MNAAQETIQDIGLPRAYDYSRPAARDRVTSPRRWRMPSATRTGTWALGCWTALVLAFLHLPSILLIVFSFNSSRSATAWGGFTFKWYGELCRNGALLEAFKNSLVIGSVTTLLSLALGTLGGWLLFRYRFRWANAIGLLVLIPMVIPEVLMGVGLLTVFVFAKLSLGFATNIIAHTTLCFPFVLIAIQARLNGMDPSLEEAASNLGARPWQTFRLVTIPYLMPAMISGALMTFTISLDEYLITVFTSGPQSQTLPLKIYGLAKVGFNPQLNALTAVFIVVTVSFVMFTELVLKKRQG